MMTGSPASRAKRPRLDRSEDEAVVDSPSIRSNIWYLDGNLVIQAEGTQFKVHRGVLGSKSEVFRDMLSLPQAPGSAEDTVEGCPLVHLPDSKNDLEHTFRAMYGEHRYFNTTKLLPISAVSAMLRLGIKYEIQDLREAALLRLSLEFPDVQPALRDSRDWEYILVQVGTPLNELATLAFIHQSETRAILPSLYFDCVVTLEFGHLVESYQNDDGSTSRLPPELVEILVKGKDSLAMKQRALLFDWFDGIKPVENCTVPFGRCTTSRVAFFRDHWQPPMAMLAVSSMRWHDDWADGLCPKCSAAAKQSFTKGCTLIWGMLPDIFGLAPIEKATST